MRSSNESSSVCTRHVHIRDIACRKPALTSVVLAPWPCSQSSHQSLPPDRAGRWGPTHSLSAPVVWNVTAKCDLRVIQKCETCGINRGVVKHFMGTQLLQAATGWPLLCDPEALWYVAHRRTTLPHMLLEAQTQAVRSNVASGEAATAKATRIKVCFKKTHHRPLIVTGLTPVHHRSHTRRPRGNGHLKSRALIPPARVEPVSRKAATNEGAMACAHETNWSKIRISRLVEQPAVYLSVGDERDGNRREQACTATDQAPTPTPSQTGIPPP